MCMARNNKYTAINFNHIYEKNNLTAVSTTATNHPSRNPNPSSSHSHSHSHASYSAISAPNKSHGRLLVLTRPTPKPKPAVAAPPSPQPQPQPQPQQQQQQPSNPVQPARSESSSDAISLRPLGRTGTGSSLSPHVFSHDGEKEPPPPHPPAVEVVSPKPNKFVPPHLRPGFVPREEKPGPEIYRSRDGARQRQHGNFGSPGRVGPNGRPMSSGHERARRGGGLDLGMMNRPRSSGNNRPSSSG